MISGLRSLLALIVSAATALTVSAQTLPVPSVQTAAAAGEPAAAELNAAEPAAAPFIDLRTPAAQPAQAAATKDSNHNTDLFVGLVVWTVIVLCLCVLTVLGIRQWQRGRGMLPVSNSSARVLETVSLGPNRMISLVSLGDVRAVVGCDAGGIRSIVLAPPSFDETLHTLDEEP